MQTRREYLVGLGLATPGRGRLSAAAHAAIDKAVSEGMTFSDMAKTSAPVKSADVAKTVKNTEQDYFGETAQRLHDGGWYVEENGKRREISGREVCRTCGYSLDYQNCSSPTFPAESGEMILVMR